MAADVPTFRARFPEFATAKDAYIAGYLTAAGLEVDASAWGLLVDEATLFLAAHRMALTPFGQGARMVNKDGSTTYGQAYAELLSSSVVGATTL